ncbi:MAG TPA: hypothetical protein VNO82_15845 [Solirubrobacteraceae bacterium]|nr:hypothetical protein [Solirubrobacteraceae bacterium]
MRAEPAGGDARRDRRAALALVLALAAALVAFYWLGLREIPEGYDCGEDIPPNDLDAFRAGAPAIHAACTLALLAAAVALSKRRNGRVGRPTAVAAPAVAAIALGAAIAPDEAGVVVFWWALIAAGLTFGTLPLAGLGLLVASALSGRDGADAMTAAGLWITATVAVPGHALLVWLQGNPICIS